VTSSEAMRLTFAKIALAARWKDVLAWSSKHFKKRQRTIKVPRYLISSTHGIIAPVVSDRGIHKALFLASVRRQYDFLALITMSSLPSSSSQVLMFVSDASIGLIAK